MFLYFINFCVLVNGNSKIVEVKNKTPEEIEEWVERLKHESGVKVPKDKTILAHRESFHTRNMDTIPKQTTITETVNCQWSYCAKTIKQLNLCECNQHCRHWQEITKFGLFQQDECGTFLPPPPKLFSTYYLVKS